jgi:hypothetical protein
MADIGTQPIKCQNDLFLLGKDAVETFLISEVDGDQFLIACQQVQHRPFSNDDPTVTQCLMQFCQTVMVAVP